MQCYLKLYWRCHHFLEGSAGGSTKSNFLKCLLISSRYWVPRHRRPVTGSMMFPIGNTVSDTKWFTSFNSGSFNFLTRTRSPTLYFRSGSAAHSCSSLLKYYNIKQAIKNKDTTQLVYWLFRVTSFINILKVSWVHRWKIKSKLTIPNSGASTGGDRPP